RHRAAESGFDSAARAVRLQAGGPFHGAGTQVRPLLGCGLVREALGSRLTRRTVFWRALPSIWLPSPEPNTPAVDLTGPNSRRQPCLLRRRPPHSLSRGPARASCARLPTTAQPIPTPTPTTTYPDSPSTPSMSINHPARPRTNATNAHIRRADTARRLSASGRAGARGAAARAGPNSA